jgi:hypothetical protein
MSRSAGVFGSGRKEMKTVASDPLPLTAASRKEGCAGNSAARGPS